MNLFTTSNKNDDRKNALAQIELAIKARAGLPDPFSTNFVRDQQDIWQRVINRRSPAEQLDDFRAATGRVQPGSPSRRRLNEWFAITGQPVEKCFDLLVPPPTSGQVPSGNALSASRVAMINNWLSLVNQPNQTLGEQVKTLENAYLALSLLLPADDPQLTRVHLMLARAYAKVGSRRNPLETIQDMLAINLGALWASPNDPTLSLKESLINDVDHLLEGFETDKQIRSLEIVEASLACQTAMLGLQACPNKLVWQGGKDRNEKFRKRLLEHQE